ncbi:hypothetical protein D7Y15_32090 [Corallococcus sp. AB030]|nr:hypothetical protein D7V77_08945 [Corallococcus sp. CA041A]RKI05969.1 hypothetical protein D7Y15_32090 [Corallococcus sp. AB030]RUO88512.1 hypothetical protein D7Y11_35080 [Corallococcus sp. AB018]
MMSAADCLAEAERIQRLLAEQSARHGRAVPWVEIRPGNLDACHEGARDDIRHQEKHERDQHRSHVRTRRLGERRAGGVGRLGRESKAAEGTARVGHAANPPPWSNRPWPHSLYGR